MLDRVIKSDGYQQNLRCVDSSVLCQFTNYELISWIFFQICTVKSVLTNIHSQMKIQAQISLIEQFQWLFLECGIEEAQNIFSFVFFCCFFNDAVYCSNAKKKKQCSTILHTSTSSNETINHFSASMSQLNEEVSNAPKKLEKQTRRVENDDDERRQ